MNDGEIATARAPVAAGSRASARLVLAGGVALVLLVAVRAPASDATRRPDRDDVVVARVPARSSPAEITLARLRASSEAAPRDMERAMTLAQAYVEAARREGDPRYLGAAEGVLRPFTDGADPPPQVRLLRAVILQSRHEFDAALDDLEHVLVARPNDAQAWLTRASIWLVKGGYEQARTSCARLVGLTSPAIALGCAASVDALTGQAPKARTALVQAISLATSPLEQSYVHSLLGEQAYWGGELEEGEKHLRAALASDPSDRYTRTVLADLLLDAGRAREVLSLSDASTSDDALLLRLGLAAHALSRSDADAQLDALAARFEDSRLRGDAVHRREEARLWLARGNPDRALTCALESFSVQKEFWDARLVLEAAAQSGRAAEAAGVVAWLDRTGLASPRLPSHRCTHRSRTMKPSVLAVLLVGALGLLAAPARAHKPSDSYLSLTRTGNALEGSWDVALRDLDRALALDGNGNGALTAGELFAREDELSDYVFAHLVLTQGQATCRLDRSPLALATHSDGGYVRLPFRAYCPSDEDAVDLGYALFFADDPQHRSVVRLADAHSEERTLVLTATNRSTTLTRDSASQGTTLALLTEGIQHILSGLDHVLFLLALLLPSVMRATGQSGVERLRAALRDVVKVVTAFTAAHSLTLGLAALGVVSVDANVIEPAIAATVIVAAADNLWPMFGQDRWSVAFALGLLHGFGFSSALSDLGVGGSALLRGLFAFNAGVEIGQLAIVMAFVPVAFLLRERWVYRVLIMRGGSLAIAIVALVWLVERISQPSG